MHWSARREHQSDGGRRGGTRGRNPVAARRDARETWYRAPDAERKARPRRAGRYRAFLRGEGNAHRIYAGTPDEPNLLGKSADRVGDRNAFAETKVRFLTGTVEAVLARLAAEIEFATRDLVALEEDPPTPCPRWIAVVALRHTTVVVKVSE